MSRAEAEAVGETGFLRGGWPGETYWTDQRYESAVEAGARLALRRPPEVRMTFIILSGPKLERDGARVRPAYDEPGGGTEWTTLELVEVEVIEVEPVD